MGRRTVVTILVFLVAIPSIYWLLGEVTVLFETLSTGAHLRTELSDDFGLGLLGFFVVLPGTLIGSISPFQLHGGIWSPVGRAKCLTDRPNRPAKVGGLTSMLGENLLSQQLGECYGH